MLDQATLTFILGILAIGGTAFGIWSSIRKPQEDSKVNDAVFDVKFQSLEKMVCNLRDNHIHTLDQKFDKHILDQQTTTEANIRQMTRIETLLEERLPRK